MDRYFRPGILTVTLLISLLLVGCGGKRTIRAPVKSPEAFTTSGSDTAPGRWWKTFGDTQLNQLVDTALRNNFDLKTAWSRLRQARARAEQEAASLYPTLDATANGELNRTDGTENDQLSLGLAADYEIDLWGRIQSRTEAEQYHAKASLSDYRTAAISLSAEVTRTWYQLSEQHQQLNLLNKQIQTNRKVYNLIKSRFGSGQTRSADLLRQEQLLESTREQKIKTESRIRVLEHQLATLIGEPPQGNLNYEPDTMPELPPRPRTGVPSDLIRRRPDVRASYLQLKAADRELAAAISNQYPRLTLTASLSSSDNNASELFEDWASAFAANLTAPLIDAGRRDAEVRRNRALKHQRLNEYGQSILSAFRDVEDALVQEVKQQERIRSLEDQLELSRKTVQRLRAQYLNGTGDYIDVLTALNEQQQLRRDRLSAHRTLLERRIALYRSLAGWFKSDSYHGNQGSNRKQ
ncbi:MAG: efflux transporter outer membrane subunit [bacterium]